MLRFKLNVSFHISSSQSLAQVYFLLPNAHLASVAALRSLPCKNQHKTYIISPRPHSVSRVTFPRNSPSNSGPGAPKISQVPRMEMSTSATATQARFSAGSDEVALGPKLQSLLAPAGGRWNLISSGEGLERSFKFKTFAKTWDFMTAVSLQCKLKNHHPEWSNVYNVTFIRWTTHSPKGLSTKDVELAVICDSLARDFGEALEDQQQGDQSCTMRNLADTVASGAGAGCCTPKPQAAQSGANKPSV
ncbi:Pterin-4-alpha-carbinolamine dehydratase [Apiospora arundinis]